MITAKYHLLSVYFSISTETWKIWHYSMAQTFVILTGERKKNYTTLQNKNTLAMLESALERYLYYRGKRHQASSWFLPIMIAFDKADK